MKFILGKKLSMSQIFDKDGNVVPVTIIEAGPCLVTQIKTKEKDSYKAVQIGFGEKSSQRIKKPQKKLGSFRWMKEFREDESGIKNYELGQKIDASVFAEGDIVEASGISKSKGFQGVVKRHHFRGFPASHGTKHGLRTSGSIGGGFPERVIKGLRMAGRMGGGRITVKNLEVAKVDAENNLLALKGAVPGKKGTLLEIRSAK